MGMFNWFSSKSVQTKAPPARPNSSNSPINPAARNSRPGTAASMPTAISPKPALDAASRNEQRKAKRHTRREQLYVAVREAMTRVGVLSASYKFKVLSLDQRGDQFLVMVDVHPDMGGEFEKLAESEALIFQTAKTLFAITVTSVYWRLDSKLGISATRPVGLDSRPAELQLAAAKRDIKKPTTQRYEPIQDDEVTAFKKALAASAAQTPATPDVAGKFRSGLRSHTLITGFEDTEMPESSAAPALSATQYGELR